MIFLVLVGWIIARLTGAMQYYIVPSPANYPALRIGDTFFTSNLVQPKRLDFIAYRHEEPGIEPVAYFHRLAALPGDTLEIRRGQLFVNGQNLDKNLHLMHAYLLPTASFSQLPPTVVADTFSLDRLAAPDSVRVGLADDDVNQYHLPASRTVLAASYFDYTIHKQYNHAWNQDNFGPVVIPADSYFVLGDNRHNSLDSRYTGLVARSRFMGTMLSKH